MRAQLLEWGIWDSVDSLWIGNDDGPLAYESNDLARVAARMADPVLGFAPGRCQARRLPQTSSWKKRDSLPNRMAPAAALAGLEEGTIL